MRAPALATAGVALALAPLGLAGHEVGHLAILWAMGRGGLLLVRTWDVGGVPLPAIHVRPDAPLPPLANLVFDFGGPALASLPLLALLVASRAAIPRAALGANIAILAFYALLESAFVLAERFAGLEGDLLLSPVLNLGVPALLIAAFAARAGGGSTRPGARPG